MSDIEMKSKNNCNFEETDIRRDAWDGLNWIGLIMNEGIKGR